MKVLPGKINVVFKVDITLPTALSRLEAVGIRLSPEAVTAALAPYVHAPEPVRLRLDVEIGKEQEWIARIKVLDGVEMCVQTAHYMPPARPGEPQRH